MPIKLTVLVPGNTQLELTCDSEHEVFQQLSFWTKLPHVCPMDGHPTRLSFRVVDKNEFYDIMSTGPTPWRKKVGQMQDGRNTLFFREDGPWSYWDGQKEVQGMPPQGGDAESAPKQTSTPTPAQPTETSATDDSPPWPEDEDVAADLFPDNQMVKAFLAVSQRMGFTRENVEKGAQIYFKTTDLNSLDYEQIQQLTERMKKRKAELDAKGA